MITLSREELYFDPAARSVAQLPGSMYPTATRNPGPANATSFRENPGVRGTGSELWISGRDGVWTSYRHARSFVSISSPLRINPVCLYYQLPGHRLTPPNRNHNLSSA